jgi:ketol-acid reductoisomerase
MAKIYRDGDADLSVLDGRMVAVLGYGNQGRSQALNLRDSGIEVVVGNRTDRFRDQAVQDGLEALPLVKATAQGDVVMILLPDEVHHEVLPAEVFPQLRQGSAVVFAHGYSTFFREVEVPAGHDVCLVAPKMLGPAVRRLYLQGQGFPSLVAVDRDDSSRAWETTLAVAKGIGSLKSGAWRTTFEEETITDLFGEQVGGSGAIVGVLRSFEALVRAGFDPDVVELELLGSGELVEVVRTQVLEGVIESLRNHSPTSQFGQLYRADEIWQEPADGRLDRILAELRDGTFAEVWRRERAEGYPRMRELEAKFLAHGFVMAQHRNRERLRGVLKDVAGNGPGRDVE